MGVITKQDFGVTSEMVRDLLEGWDTDWRREGQMRIRRISCLYYAVFIGFCGGLWGEEFFLTHLKGMLKLWEETIKEKYPSHIMVTLKGRFKGETGEKWHMLPLLVIT